MRISILAASFILLVSQTTFGGVMTGAYQYAGDVIQNTSLSPMPPTAVTPFSAGGASEVPVQFTYIGSPVFDLSFLFSGSQLTLVMDTTGAAISFPSQFTWIFSSLTEDGDPTTISGASFNPGLSSGSVGSVNSVSSADLNLSTSIEIATGVEYTYVFDIAGLSGGPVAAVPEPSSVALFTLGGFGLFAARRRQQKCRPVSHKLSAKRHV